MVYELWCSETERSYIYLPRDCEYEEALRKQLAMTPDLTLAWTYEATSYFDAMRARNTHLGFEPYRPEPDWQDEIYDS